MMAINQNTKLKKMSLDNIYKTYHQVNSDDIFSCTSFKKNAMFVSTPDGIIEIINLFAPTGYTRNISQTEFSKIFKQGYQKKSINVNRKFIDDSTSFREVKNSKYEDISDIISNYYNYISSISKQNKVNEQPSIKQNEKKVSNTSHNLKKSVHTDRAYDLSILNTDSNYPLEKVISGVQNFANQWKNGTNKVKNCALLFHGFPGTGKTEFGKYLADQTGLSITIKRASEIIDKYVGETEKILSSLFSGARYSKSIIMLDEADTFLESRAKFDRSFEISRVNELLCQIEQHEGIIICSTNFLSNFDSAAMRRFIFKIEFKPLTVDGKHIIAKKMLSEVCDIPEDLSDLDKIDLLTPGDFKAVRDRLLIIHSNKVTWEEVINELKLEINYKLNDEYYKKFLFNK